MFPLFGNLVGEEEFDPVNQILTNEIILLQNSISHLSPPRLHLVFYSALWDGYDPSFP